MSRLQEVAVAMDWGGTWARVAVVDHRAGILWRSQVRNAISGDRGELLAAAEGLLQQAIAWAGKRPIAGVGIALAGPVDATTGTLYGSPHLSSLNGISLKALWEPVLGQRVWVGNDANLAAPSKIQPRLLKALTQQPYLPALVISSRIIHARGPAPHPLTPGVAALRGSLDSKYLPSNALAWLDTRLLPPLPSRSFHPGPPPPESTRRGWPQQLHPEPVEPNRPGSSWPQMPPHLPVQQREWEIFLRGGI